MNVITNDAVCPITVARAAPVIPHLNTKIKSGSRMIFVIAPVSIESMAYVGLPSALIVEFRVLQMMNTGIMARTTFRYSIAYGKVFCDAPKRVRIGVLKLYTTIIITMLEIKATVMLAPMDL